MDTHTPSASSDMPHLSTGFDQEMDKFLDLDQNVASSSSTSPETRSKSSAGQSSSGSNFGGSQSQQTFSGPSFQYDSYKQQTGLPVGGLANTFALNQANGMQYNGYGNGFIMPMETLNVPLTSLDEFDFAAYPSMEMDFEADSPTENMFYPSGSSSKEGFVNPNALLGQESASSSSSAPVQRMYPGMHSQLAAQAKAQQAQKNNTASQQPRQMPVGQRPLSQNSKPQAAKDPHVEESITRLLNQMRQSSVTSMDDEASTPTANLPHLARLKKDEDEMDEDERLLASEEGKKLSSKERRQLRNKVSARAFRSRRKGKKIPVFGAVISKLTITRIHWPARRRSRYQGSRSQRPQSSESSTLRREHAIDRSNTYATLITGLFGLLE
jgi:bZIP-type transcription factor MBZ1